MLNSLAGHLALILGNEHHFIKHLLQLLCRHRPLPSGERADVTFVFSEVRQHTMYRLQHAIANSVA